MAATSPRAPQELGTGGKALWRDIVKDHELDAVQRVQLLEACRAKDRLDKLDLILRGDADTWVDLVHRTQTEDYEIRIDDALAKANATGNLLKQLLAALRLPDEAGKKPQQRGGARGSYKPTAASTGKATAASSGKVSSLERARAAKSGA
ncbi:hypothetical protein [Rhodococcus sp. JVH1]|uniref:hypothetical protein n=1 Tax=Rhodococcus sp. JVH1 TaxID=745408 RepID=UPI00027207F9|nr:hypothetical protein [Rhodococcus sp. JVH1]EJJ01030.1 hypothetical protein JVH1_1656 [Rhodococcus sp. JVH1]